LKLPSLPCRYCEAQLSSAANLSHHENSHLNPTSNLFLPTFAERGMEGKATKSARKTRGIRLTKSPKASRSSAVEALPSSSGKRHVMQISHLCGDGEAASGLVALGHSEALHGLTIPFTPSLIGTSLPPSPTLSRLDNHSRFGTPVTPMMGPGLHYVPGEKSVVSYPAHMNFMLDGPPKYPYDLFYAQHTGGSMLFPGGSTGYYASSEPFRHF
jgi:hypothetical protein